MHKSTRLFASFALILALYGCADPERDWELAARDDTREVYLEFLAKHPTSSQATLARARIEALTVINAWERARVLDNEAEYSKFLQKYPRSEFAEAATERINGIRRKRLWADVQAADDIESLTAFLAEYPAAPEREQAENRIAELRTALAAAAAPVVVAPAERPGNFRAQLGAFRSVSSAATELRRLDKRFPDLLPGPIRIEGPDAHGRDGWFLLKSTPLNYDEAQAMCAELARRRQQCMIINR